MHYSYLDVCIAARRGNTDGTGRGLRSAILQKPPCLYSTFHSGRGVLLRTSSTLRETLVAAMLSLGQAVPFLIFASRSAIAYNFPFESIQLKESDVGNNSDIAFGKLPASVNTTRCKTYAGDANWPSVERWNAFNASIDGALVKGIPPAAACYEGPYFNPAKCASIKPIASSTNFV